LNQGVRIPTKVNAALANYFECRLPWRRENVAFADF